MSDLKTKLAALLPRASDAVGRLAPWTRAWVGVVATALALAALYAGHRYGWPVVVGEIAGQVAEAAVTVLALAVVALLSHAGGDGGDGGGGTPAPVELDQKPTPTATAAKTTSLAAVYVVTLIALFSLAGCAGGLRRDDAVTALNTTRATIVTLTTTAELAYESAHQRAYDDAKAKAETKEQLQARFESLRADWAPFWLAISKLRLAHAELVRQLREPGNVGVDVLPASVRLGAALDAAAGLLDALLREPKP